MKVTRIYMDRDDSSYMLAIGIELGISGYTHLLEEGEETRIYATESVKLSSDMMKSINKVADLCNEEEYPHAVELEDTSTGLKVLYIPYGELV